MTTNALQIIFFYFPTLPLSRGFILSKFWNQIKTKDDTKHPRRLSIYSIKIDSGFSKSVAFLTECENYVGLTHFYRAIHSYGMRVLDSVRG